MQSVFLAVLGFCLLLQIDAFPKHLPSSWIKCYYNNPDLTDCLPRTFESAIKQLDKPLEELGLPSLEPLYIDRIFLDVTAGPVQVKQLYNDIKIFGLTSVTIKRVYLNLDLGILDLEANLAKVVQQSKYHLEGTALFMPIKNKGECSFYIGDIDLKARAHFRIVNVGGEDYINATRLEFQLSPKSAQFKLKSYNNQQQAKFLQNALNNNWRTLVDVALPKYQSVLSAYAVDFANGLFSQVPIGEFLPDYKTTYASNHRYRN